jgi:hypothetical protein
VNHGLARYGILGSLTLMVVCPSWGQKTGPSQPPKQPPGRAPSTPTLTRPSAPGVQRPTFIDGRVTTDSGQPVSESVSVELSCGMRSVQVIHPDLNGSFQFILGTGPQNHMDMTAANDTPMSADAARTDLHDASTVGRISRRRLSGCELRVSAPGYQPLSKSIIDTEDLGRINAGTLILTRVADAGGTTISVTSLLAPKRARKEFEAGQRDARNNHLDSAMRHLEKAVAGYDKYAVAWQELGRVYAIKHRTDEAHRAFTKSIAADPQYVSPYVSLAVLELEAGQYDIAVETAGKALELHPGIVFASYIQAVANFKLNRLDAAEQSARDAEKGPHQNIQQLHILLADIFLRKQEPANAAAEMRAYLKEWPQGQFAGELKSRLGQIEESAPTSSASPEIAP